MGEEVEKSAMPLSDENKALVLRIMGRDAAESASAQIEHLLNAARAEAASSTPERLATDLVGAAEAEVGRYVYRRIEVLMDAKPGTADAAELTYLAKLAESVEEYGEDACAGSALVDFPTVPAEESSVEAFSSGPDRVAMALYDGFTVGISRLPWGDCYDWAALVARDYSAGKPLPAPPKATPAEMIEACITDIKAGLCCPRVHGCEQNDGEFCLVRQAFARAALIADPYDDPPGPAEAAAPTPKEAT